MNKKTTGLIAGAAGAALLMGGATFALWSDSATVEGADLTAGNLDVGEIQQSWKDADGNRVNFEEFRIVPGDSIYGTVTVPAALEGDHMFAELSIAGFNLPTGQLLHGLEVADVTVALDGDSFAITEAKPILFASEDNANPGNLPTLDTDSEFVVTATVTFSENVGERGNGTRELAQTKAALEDFSVTLTQVRR